MAIISCSVQRSNWYDMYIEYSYTQDISNNTTTISHALKLKQLTNGYDFNGTMSVTYYVAGQAFSYNGNVNIDDKGNAGYTIIIKNGTTVVSHSTDGTKSITFSCSGNCNSGGWGPGTISLTPTTITLPTIARASNITSALNITLGNACNVTWTPASSGFGYKLQFVIGNWSYTTDYIYPYTTNSYTYTGYTIPVEVSNQLPNTTSGTMTVYLYSYSGSTQIGLTASSYFIVYVPSNIVPTLNTVSVAIDNSNPVVNEWGVAVAGYTKVKLFATASGSYNSTVSGFEISGGYNTTQNGTSLNYISEAISSSGDKIFTIVAKDSRGRSSNSKSTAAITFYPYSAPKISSFVVARSSEKANAVVVTANWSFASVNGKNATTGVLYYKKSSDQNWIEYGEISINTSTTLTKDFDEISSYNFKVIVTDTLSNSAQEEGFISTIDVTMDFRAGGKGVGIGKIAESDNLEIAFDTIFMGNVYIQSEDRTKIPLADYIRNLITEYFT